MRAKINELSAAYDSGHFHHASVQALSRFGGGQFELHHFGQIAFVGSLFGHARHHQLLDQFHLLGSVSGPGHQLTDGNDEQYSGNEEIHFGIGSGFFQIQHEKRWLMNEWMNVTIYKWIL